MATLLELMGRQIRHGNIVNKFIARDVSANRGTISGPAVVTVLVMITAFASVFSLILGYSRVPYAAALDGSYFKAFARVHPVHHFPLCRPI